MENGYYHLKNTLPVNNFNKINYNIVDGIKIINKSKNLVIN